MSVEELWDAYSAGTVDKIVKTPCEDYGSLKPRTRPLQLGPQLMSPEAHATANERILFELSVQSTALVVRTITTITNYDYMWDFIFYQNGAVETKVHTTGHITSSFLVQDSVTHDHKHTHFIHFSEPGWSRFGLGESAQAAVPGGHSIQSSVLVALDKVETQQQRQKENLTRDEHQQVQEYLLRQKDLNISTRQSTRPDQNYLFLIDLHLPKKSQVLNIWTHTARTAKRGHSSGLLWGQSSSRINCLSLSELLFESFSVNEKHKLSLNEAMPRVKCTGENKTWISFCRDLSGYYLQPVALRSSSSRINCLSLSELLFESFSVDEKHKLSLNEAMPRVKCTGENKTWISFCRDLSGYYLQPVALRSSQYFMSVEELWDAYSAGTVDKIVKTPWEDYGSLKSRTRPLQLGPQLMSPEGARYSVRHNQVLYLDWSFAFGLSAVTGMRVFDVRFRNERILYELSVQEAMSVYGSVTPGMDMTKFLDSGILLMSLCVE
ncbi:hypothetical protein WMY93_033593 [Mugilogobius chulae]|uniref:Amine oxidase n=1 Tax=Mugilogobius chulae TaxID=88201 RepID=A0AAW0MIA4_9GOBI